MSDIGCTVTFEGDHGGTYYVPCEYVESIDQETLINTSNTTITLYPSIRHYNGNNSYNYIRLNSYSYPLYYSSYSSYDEITNVSNVTFNSNAAKAFSLSYINLFLMFLLALASLCVVFRKGR